MTEVARPWSGLSPGLAGERGRTKRAAALGVLPWVGLLVGFVAAYAWIRRDWIWIVGDDQNLMMPAIDLGRGLVPNIDFVNGYPGLTFHVQRAIMLLVGELPIAEHVYTALQVALFAFVSGWVLRRHIPVALTSLLVLFLWTVTYRLNPTPNPGNVMQTLAILSLYWMDRFATNRRLSDAIVAGSIGGLAFMFKQPGIFLPVAFLLFSSFLAVRWPARPLTTRWRAAVTAANVVPLLGFVVVYLGASVFGVIDDPEMRRSLLLSTVVFVGPWAAAVVGLARIGAGPPDDGPAWSIGAIVKANMAFLVAFLAVSIAAFGLIYGSVDRGLKAFQQVIFEGPQTINATQSQPLQPLLLWPTVAIAMLIVLCPFIIGAVNRWPVRLAVFAAAAAGCAYTALEYSDLQFTIIGTLMVIAFTTLFLLRRPTDRASWNLFFLFLAGTCLLAYLVPHPKYTYSLALLAVTGWLMLGKAAPRTWPATMNAVAIVAVAVIAALTLRWAGAEAAFIREYAVGSHIVRSYDSTFAAAVSSANASSLADWRRERYDYLVYLAHLP